MALVGPFLCPDAGAVSPDNVFLDAITTHSDSDAVPIDAVIAWFDTVKKVPRLRQRTMAVVPAVERPLVAGVCLCGRRGGWLFAMGAVVRVCMCALCMHDLSCAPPSQPC